MDRWYETALCDRDVVVGGQVCLVRNIFGYPFEAKMTPDQQKELLARVCRAVRAEEDNLSLYFEYKDLSDLDKCARSSLISRLAFPPLMLGNGTNQALLVTGDEQVSILINGTEHICIQVSTPGRQIKEALRIADCVDDALNEHLIFAYSDRYGYLTASPLYTGTGLSASYLMHLPYLEKHKMAGRYSKELSQLGFTFRGHFKGKSQAPADLYRVKNGKTLGLSEIEIISALEHLTGMISSQERKLWNDISQSEKKDEIDQMYRAYGILKYARDLGFEETLEYLSYVRTGYQYNIWQADKPQIFAKMIGIQDAVLISAKEENEEEIKDSGEKRALYIRETLPGIETF